MKRVVISILSAAVSGILFGVGLSVARMTDPQKIWNFLDVASIPSGGWDPSLAFVMIGGIAIGFFGLRLDRWLRLGRPLAGPAFIKTHRTRIDTPLVVGAAVFGIGWGLSGFCPGPAIADLGLVPQNVYLFVIAMVAGSWIAGQILEWTERPQTPATASAVSSAQ
jgi:uncharacterized membrane protein YedE/YeeE